MQGAYNFKFGPSTVTLKQKLEKVSGEPIAYFLFKRRDLEQKINKLAVGQLRLARLIFSIASKAKKEHEYNKNVKLKAAYTRERDAKEAVDHYK